MATVKTFLQTIMCNRWVKQEIVMVGVPIFKLIRLILNLIKGTFFSKHQKYFLLNQYNSKANTKAAAKSKTYIFCLVCYNQLSCGATIILPSGSAIAPIQQKIKITSFLPGHFR